MFLLQPGFVCKSFFCIVSKGRNLSSWCSEKVVLSKREYRKTGNEFRNSRLNKTSGKESSPKHLFSESSQMLIFQPLNNARSSFFRTSRPFPEFVRIYTTFWSLKSFECVDNIVFSWMLLKIYENVGTVANCFEADPDHIEKTGSVYAKQSLLMFFVFTVIFIPYVPECVSLSLEPVVPCNRT